MRSQGWWVLAGMLMAGSAHAQVQVTIDADEVMVVPIFAEQRDLADEADALDDTLEAIVAENHVLTSIDQVPAFEEQGYDARTYMESCPPGQYAGCMLVVAQRVEMDWAIGGTLEPADLGRGERQLTVHIVDVTGSREVMAFGVVVGGPTDDGEVLRGVSSLFQQVVDGLAEEVDVRGDLDDPMAQEAFEARRQKLIAASLAQLEEKLGEVIREEIAMGRLDPPRLTKKELQEQYADRDDRPPWERVGMSQAQYVRFENSGATLVEWRRRLRGRLGQILLRVDVGGGPGPWGLHHEGRWLVGFDNATGQFRNLAIRQYQQGRRTGASSLQFELGFGVLPWVEVAGVYGLKNAPYTFRFKQDVADEPAIEGKLQQTPGSTTEFGGRIQFVPMPTYQVRPTVHAGLFTWSGSSIDPGQEPMIVLEAPRATYAQVGAGAELSAGRYLNLFTRFHKDILLSGTFFDERQEGEVTLLENFEEPMDEPTMGWGIQVGFQVRIGLLPDPSDRIESATVEDDLEPDF